MLNVNELADKLTKNNRKQIASHGVSLIINPDFLRLITMKNHLYYLLLLLSLSVSAQDYQRAAQITNEGDSIRDLGSKYNLFLPENVEKAIEYYTEALTYDSIHYNALVKRAFAYRVQKRYEEGLRDLLKAIEHRPFLSPAYYTAGLILQDMGRYSDAIDYYRLSAFEQSKKYVDSYHNIADVYDDIEEYDSAIHYFDIALELDPSLSMIYANRGLAKMKNKMYPECIADYEIVLKEDPQHRIAYNNMGSCYYYMGKYKKAIRNYKKSLSVDLGAINETYEKRHSIVKYSLNNMANAYFAKGNTKRACEYWQKALAEGYKYQRKWKRIFNIDDPVDLIEKHCH